MRFAYTILYVEDVPATAKAWTEAFALQIAYLHDDGIYAELSTGETTLAFAEVGFGRSHFDDAATQALFDRPPARFEVGLETEAIHAAYAHAVAAGFIGVLAPAQRPWGQWVGFLRDANGILVELSSPIPTEAE